MMSGWKTWVGGGLFVSAGLAGFLGYSDLVQPLLALAAAFGVVGIGHKIEKASQ